MKVIIAGPKKFNNYEEAKEIIDKGIKELGSISEILAGNFTDSDKIAEKYAKENNIRFIQYTPDWKNIKNVPKNKIGTNKFGKYNKGAAFERNDKMISDADAVIVISIEDSEDIIRKANENNLKVIMEETKQSSFNFWE